MYYLPFEINVAIMDDRSGYQFSFSQWDKPVDWRRVREADVSKIMHSGGTASASLLLRHLEDVAYGKATDEVDIPEDALKAFRMVQCAVQYLSYCNEELTYRGAMLEQARDAAVDDVKTLHSKFLSRKMKRRQRKSELRRCDDLIASYDATMMMIDPELATRLRNDPRIDVDAEVERIRRKRTGDASPNDLQEASQLKRMLAAQEAIFERKIESVLGRVANSVAQDASGLGSGSKKSEDCSVPRKELKQATAVDCADVPLQPAESPVRRRDIVLSKSHAEEVASGKLNEIFCALDRDGDGF